MFIPWVWQQQHRNEATLAPNLTPSKFYSKNTNFKPESRTKNSLALPVLWPQKEQCQVVDRNRMIKTQYCFWLKRGTFRVVLHLVTWVYEDIFRSRTASWVEQHCGVLTSEPAWWKRGTESKKLPLPTNSLLWFVSNHQTSIDQTRGWS